MLSKKKKKIKINQWLIVSDKEQTVNQATHVRKIYMKYAYVTPGLIYAYI